MGMGPGPFKDLGLGSKEPPGSKGPLGPFEGLGPGPFKGLGPGPFKGLGLGPKRPPWALKGPWAFLSAWARALGPLRAWVRALLKA